MDDILTWEPKSSGRGEQDPICINEAGAIYAVWKGLNNGDGVLFERNAAMAVVYSVFHLQ